MFFDVNQHYCPLESPTAQHFIPFGGFPTDILYRKQFEVIMPFLRARPRPCKLSLESGCISLLIQALDTGVCIGSLRICGSRIEDEDMERFLSAQNSQYLLELELNSIRVSRRGYDAFAIFLGRESTTIQRLDFGRSPLDLDSAQMLLQSIPTSSTLRHIELGRLYQRGDEDSFNRAVQILKDLICDQSSFSALCGSNHQLEHIGHDRAQVMRLNTLREALEINGRQKCSINQKRRSKLRAFYFQGEFDIHTFVHMDVVLMPGVLELVTMSEECIVDKKKGRAKKGTYVTARNGHLGCIYRLVRNCHMPELFSFPSQQAQMEQLQAKNAELETTIGSLKQNIEWLNEKLLYMCAPTSYYEPNKRLKRKAKQ